MARDGGGNLQIRYRNAIQANSPMELHQYKCVNDCKMLLEVLVQPSVITADSGVGFASR